MKAIAYVIKDSGRFNYIESVTQHYDFYGAVCVPTIEKPSPCHQFICLLDEI